MSPGWGRERNRTPASPAYLGITSRVGGSRTAPTGSGRERMGFIARSWFDKACPERSRRAHQDRATSPLSGSSTSLGNRLTRTGPIKNRWPGRKAVLKSQGGCGSSGGRPMGGFADNQYTCLDCGSEYSSANGFHRRGAIEGGLPKLRVHGAAQATEMVSLGQGLRRPDERRVNNRRYGHGYDRSGTGPRRFDVELVTCAPLSAFRVTDSH